MKILFVTTDFYPIYGTTVNIITNLIYNGLQDKIDQIDVLTIKNSFLDKDEQNLKGVNIFRATSWLNIKKKDINILLDNNNWAGVSYFLILKIWKKFFLRGNELLRAETVFALRKRLSDIKADSYDFIIPIAANYDTICAVIGYLHKNRKAKMIIYQVDPCSTNYNRKRSEILFAKAFEKNIYSKADAILTMPCIYDDIKNFIDDKNIKKFYKVELPLVVNREDLNDKTTDLKRKILCIFVGNIYGGIRNPEYIIRLFSDFKIQKIAEMHFVGSVDKKYIQLFHQNGIVYHGSVSIHEAEKFIDRADVLVNIGNKMINQIPSKIFDYISTGKPIINTFKNENCPTLKYLKNYPLAINLNENKENIDNTIEKVLEFIHININERISQNEINKMYYQCTPLFCAERIFSILDNLQKKGRKK